jgi:predicted Zn-dependent protease
MDRIEQLKQLIQRTPDAPFPRYGLAMEYRRLGRGAEARPVFAEIVARFPDYVPVYLMFGNLLMELDEPGEAARIYRQGLAVAERAGDARARGELAAALAEAEEGG